MNTNKTLALFASLALLSACGQPSGDTTASTETTTVETTTTEGASHSAATLPLTTTSVAARDLFNAGLADLDNSRNVTANKKFLAAAEADPNFAMAYMMAAWTAASTEGFVTNTELASANLEGATRGEQLLVNMMERFLASDAQGAITAAMELTELHPDAPRAWGFLGATRANVSDAVKARTAFRKSIQLDPNYVPGHINLGNNLMLQEPKKFAGAEKHFRRAIALTPHEPNPHDLLGDVHRAQGNLAAAYEDYTKAAELAPLLGSGLQQRGHVNSFLGNYDEARSDYARGADLEDARGSTAGPAFRVFGAYVNLHEGKHDAAIAELQGIADGLDGSSMDGADDTRVNALLNIALIATEDGNADVAGAAIASASAIAMGQADKLDSDDVRDGVKATQSYFEGMLAARMGNGEAATAKAAEFETHVASSSNPQKLQRMHDTLGMNAYYQEDFAAAAQHLAQGNHVNNMYVKYYLARANEAAGNAEEAARLYGELAVYNFNGPGYAMFRKDIQARAGG